MKPKSARIASGRTPGRYVIVSATSADPANSRRTMFGPDVGLAHPPSTNVGTRTRPKASHRGHQGFNQSSGLPRASPPSVPVNQKVTKTMASMTTRRNQALVERVSSSRSGGPKSLTALKEATTTTTKPTARGQDFQASESFEATTEPHSNSIVHYRCQLRCKI